MPWVNLDDQFPKHPKVAGLSDSEFRLHVSGICYCSQYLTDGLVPIEVVPLLMARHQRPLRGLADRGLWVPHGDVYEIHDYLQWNRSREQIEYERNRKSKAGRKGAEARWHQS